MSRSGYSSLRERIRKSIRDTYGLLWPDDALDEIIGEARREYSLESGAFTALTTPVMPNSGGVLSAPGDFFCAQKFFDMSEREVPFVSWRRLHQANGYDFRRITGKYLKAVCFDFDGYGRYRLFPLLPEGEPAGRLLYKRICTEEESTRNPDAIEAHCLYQMNLLTGKSGTAAYYEMFRKAVNRERSSQQTMNNRGRSRIGVYF